MLTAVADRGQAGLDALARGRARARERAWLARAELSGVALPAARAAGVDLDYLVIDLDATVVVCHWREGVGDSQPFAVAWRLLAHLGVVGVREVSDGLCKS